MIYLFTALYCEAHMLIRQLCLTKNPENKHFQEFYNEEEQIRLIITGAGEICAAAAVGSTCAVYKPGPNDMLLNVGICAHTVKSMADHKNDGIFLCHKITEQATGKTFYPDMLYRHEFCEAAIVTGMLPWNGDDSDGLSAGVLYDMEAAAVYQAGSCFFGPHQMSFLKVVSDTGKIQTVSPGQTEQLMETYQDPVIAYIRQMQKIAEKNGERPCLQQEEMQFEKLCADLHCSQAMRDSLRQYIRYLTLAGGECFSLIQEMYEKGLLPCKDKREGKLRFEEFKRKVF